MPPPTLNAANNGVINSLAYDPKHQIYLQVWVNACQVYGQMIGTDGVPKGAPFAIPVAWRTCASFPSVAYSDGSADDVFFVLFSSDYVPPTWKVFGQIVRHVDNGTTGAELVVPPGANPAISPNFAVSDFSFVPNVNQPADDLVFNPDRRQFLAVWYDSRGQGDVFARHFGVDGSVGGPEIDVSDAIGNQGLASVAYDWQRHRYMFAYQGAFPAPGPEILGVWGKILDSSGAPLTGLLELGYGPFIEPDVVYLPEAESFMASWTSLAGGRNVVGRLTSWGGQFLSDVYPIMASSFGEGAPNALYHPDARNVMVSAMHDNKRIVGVNLNAQGLVPTGGFDLSTVLPGPTGAGSFYSELAAGPNGQLGVGYILNYLFAVLDRHQGPVAPTPGPRPGGGGGPQPIPNPAMALDYPNAGVVQQPFMIAGWAIDAGATSGTGVDGVHVWAWPASGAPPIFLGQAGYGAPRGDVGVLFGAQFTNSGYGLLGQGLAGGTYHIAVYSHSYVSNSFSLNKTVTVTISDPLMVIEAPRWADTVSRDFFWIGGWAIDRASTSGTGVDTLHCWAYPVAGGDPLWCGIAAVGGPRPDVGAVFGPQFNTAGYLLIVQNFPPGLYDFVLFSHSVVAGSFNTNVLIRLNVQ